MPEMLLAQDQEVIQTLVSKRLGESFGERVQVGSERPDSFDSGSLRRPDGIKLLRVLRIVIDDQHIGRGETQIGDRHRGVPSLLRDPGRVWVRGDPADDGSFRLGTDEEQDKEIDHPLGGHRLNLQEVTGPQGFGVSYV